VKANFRNAITIPEKSWSRFGEIFLEYVDKLKEGGSSSSGPAQALAQQSTASAAAPGPAVAVHTGPQPGPAPQQPVQQSAPESRPPQV